MLLGADGLAPVEAEHERMQMQGDLGRVLAATVLVVGLAACGGRPPNAVAATSGTGPTQTTPPAVETGAPGDPTAGPATPAPTLDLPDLSAVQADLGAIDGALASDAAAPSDEGSDK